MIANASTPVRIARRVCKMASARLLGPMVGTVTHVVTDRPIAALTFDDGPDPASTPKLIDLLARHRAAGTFFMLGEAARDHPGIVRDVAREGHAIGNHSWAHDSFALLPRPERLAQIRACQRVLEPYGQPLFRPPFGEQSLGARIDLAYCGYDVIAWNMDSEDWWNPDASAIADQLVRRIHPGCIVVLHDSIHRAAAGEKQPEILRKTLYDRGPMLAALDMVLDELSCRFRFVTVPELIRQGRPQRRIWSSWRDAA